MDTVKPKSNPYELLLHKNNIYFLLATFVWIGTYIIVDKAQIHNWINTELVATLAIVGNTILGLVMVFTYFKLVSDMDELQRKIQYSALAFAMGVTYVGSFCYSLLVTYQLVIDVEVSDLILLMTIAFMGAVTYGQVKFR